MNWLAHLYLTPPTPEGWLGALLGDALRGPIPESLDPAVQDAVTLHRRLDHFTDTHATFRRSKRRLAARHGHYRGIMVDVIYDHLLADGWASWSTEPLEGFVARVFAALDPLEATMPARLRAYYPRMRDEGWLTSYAEIDGITGVLERMSRRMRRKYPLHEAVAELQTELTGFQADFRSFFQEAIAAAGRAQ